MLNRLGIVLVAALIAGDGGAGTPPAAEAIYVNGAVYTVDDNRPWAEALAVSGGKLIAVGSNEEVTKLRVAGTQVVDLGGRMVMPGIHDMHVHPLDAAIPALFECSFPFSLTLELILGQVARCAAEAPAGAWVRGGQWPTSLLDAPTPPTRQMLDAVSGDHPVFLMDWAVHNAWVNTRGLQALGIVAETATGILLDDAAYRAQRQLPAYSPGQYQQAAGWAIEQMLAVGITSFKDAMTTDDNLAAYHELGRSGALNARAHTCLAWKSAWSKSRATEVKTLARRGALSGPMLRTDCAKIMLDGIPVARTSALLEPYLPDAKHGDDYRGTLNFEPAELARDVIKLDRMGLTVKIHATGDRSARVALDAFAAARQRNPGGRAIHEVSHAELISDADLPRFKALNVAAEMCPVLWYPGPSDAARIAAIGAERAGRFWPTRNLLDSGALVFYGSDWPAVAPNPSPWPGLEAMVTRRNPYGAMPGRQWPEQAIDLAQAIRIFTINGAIAGRSEELTGSLTPGKAADFIVLDRNLFKIPADEISDTRVLKTVVAGKLVHDEPAAAAQTRRPNVLLIVVDDMGNADLGAFGGEIDTPNLDALAMQGLRLTNLHTASMCSPSRAMLLTGVDSHRAGLGNMLEELSPNQKGQPGYEGYLNDRVVTLATLLKNAGYRTYMTGKWHLGAAEHGPAYRGFMRSFTLDAGGASHFADMRPAYAPSPDVKASYREDGVALQSLPENFHYSSQFYVDRLIDYLEEGRGSDKPFFAYLAFTAPHWPLQAPDAAIQKYAHRYDAGYDVIAAKRLARQKALGLIPRSAQLAQRAPKGKPWNTLSAAEQKVEARAMEVYAAMVDQLDVNTGRLIDYLRRTDRLDDTIIIFLSDNGPEGHDLDETWPAESFPEIRHTIDTTHDFSFENMGRPGSYVLYGPNWARASSPALRMYKGFPTEGGTRVAAFVRYPKLVQQAAISNEFIAVRDIAPTLLDMIGIAQPSDGRNEPMSGRSVLAALAGKPSDGTLRVMADELLGKRYVRQGPWKILHMPEPWGNDAWQLYDLDQDLAEQHDLAGSRPDKVQELETLWQDYQRDNGVILPDWVSGY
ncbi:MAG: amidohydrolase family protein [Steroidobacteraceae bacterium]